MTKTWYRNTYANITREVNLEINKNRCATRNITRDTFGKEVASTH
jgi:hypothetical protein